MTGTELIAEIKALSEASDDSQILRWINRGLKILSKAARIPAESYVEVTTDYKLYDIPENSVKLDGVSVEFTDESGVTKEYWLSEIVEKQVGELTGVPLYYYKRGKLLGFYPEYDGSGTSLIATLNYFKYADDVTADTEPDIHEEYQDALINFAVSKAKEVEEEYTSARKFMDAFLFAKAELERSKLTEDVSPRQVKVVFS